MALKDKLVQGDITARQLYPSRPSYTLTDLRNDDEFVQTAERYLKSINQGEDVDDLFQYFRGVDFNLHDAHRAWKDSKDFTEDQKKDYLYLENKFRNAKVGGFKEKAQLGIDVAQEIVSDPTILASALFIPWSGGASIGGRIAAGAAAKAGLKTMVADQIKKSPLPKGLLTGGQFLKQPLTNKQTYAVLAAEGFGYGGTYDYVMQGRELELGQREGIDLGQTATSATITGVASPLIYGGAKQLFKVPSKIRNIEEQRLANIDHNENYKPTLIEKGTEKFYNVVGNYGGMILKPTTPLLPKAKISELLSTLLKKFRYDAEEGIIPKDIGLQEKLLNDYNARLGALGGVYKERVEKILKKYELFSYNKKNLALPFTAGHFLNPFRSKTIKTRKSLTYNRSLSDEVNNDLAYYLRSGKNKIVDILPDGTKQTRKLDENIIKAGKEIKPLLEDMIFRASESGLNVGYIKGFFPRFWRTDVIRNNKDEFIEKIMKQEDVPYEKAFEIWEELSTLKTGKTTSGFNITSRLEKTRALKNINDEDFGKFLNNDVQGVLGDYFLDAAKIITRAEMFGADIKAFRKNWIRPIQRELGKNRLSDRQVQYLEDLYYYTTGIKGQIDTSKPFRRAGQFLSDFLTVSMQTSLLGFSALTSLSEISVPLLKGAPVKEGWNSIRKSVVDSADEWWDKQKVSFGPYLNDIGKEFKRDPNLDIRSQNRQELNAFLKSLDVGAEDRLMAIYGQAIGKNFTKVQNAFFRTVGLYDWTRFVQLVGYDLGKSIIYRNLKAIDDLNKGIIKQTNKNKVNAARLGDELKELGIDIDDGLKWINRGAKHTDAYYEQYVRQAAARYTDEVVMNPTAASAQKPLLHSRAGTKWIFGLTGFPTAFSNTVLRNVAKNFVRDGKTMYVGGTKVSGLHAITAAMFMTQIGILNYTIRTQGRNLKEYEEGTLTAEEMVLRGMAYSGLLGPAEIPYRYEQAIEYESKIYAAITAGVGPNVPDLVNYVHAVATRGAVLETVLKRAPFAAAVKSTNPEIFDKALQEVREIDKEYFGPAKSEKKTEFEPFAKGGLVGEETIEGPKVPFTKENAAERINPYTGEPYRVPLSAGGSLASKLASKITSSYTKADQELLDSLQKGESRTPFKQGGPTNRKLENFKNVVDKVIGEYETKEEYVVKLNDALNPFMERTFPRGVELLKRDLVDYVFGGEDQISFKNKVEKNVVNQNKNSAMNIISQDFQRKINLSQPGWNPSKTASVLKGDLSFMKSERVKLNLGGQLAVRAITPKTVAKVNPGISKTDLRTGVYPMTVSQRRLEADPAFEGFTVYHGSPFNFQKFEAGDKLLTGEGANAFGKGLYFTENESIAKTYRQQLTKKHELDRLNKESQELSAKISEKDSKGLSTDKEFKKLSDNLKEQNNIEESKIDVSDRGTLYEAKVRTSPYHLVDWDKKIADQPVRIIDSFNKIIETLDNTQLDELINALNNYPAWTRDDTMYSRQQLIFDAIYHVSETKSQDVIPVLNRILNLRNLKNNLEKPQTKSKKIYVEDMLKEDGVQGIKYFDGFSRKGKSKKQRNYVIFDPRIIEISKKYAVPIPLAGKLLMEMDKERENEI